MPEKLSVSKGHRRSTYLLLVIFSVLVIGGIIIGFNDAPGYILGYLATTVLFFTITRTWRRIKSFIILFAASLLGIFFLSFLYVEVIRRLAELIGGVDALQSTTMDIITMVITYVILFAGPVGMLVGVVGIATLGVVRLLALRNRNRIADST